MLRAYDDAAFIRAAAESKLFSRDAFEHLASFDCESSDDKLVKSLVNQSSYAGKRLTTNTQAPANIHKPEFRDFWLNSLKPDSLVRDTILNGYSLPFTEEPPESFEENNRSARNDMTFVREEIKRLESLGCIVKTVVWPKLVLPLSSVFSKKKRLVVDASRCLNPFLRTRKVRLTDLRDVPDLIREGDYLMADDLDSGYWHLGINPAFYKYHGIHIPEEDGSVSYYFWRVLFLGISDAVFIFTAILKPVVVFLHTLGFRSGIYIDDILSMGDNILEALRCNTSACDTLAKAGFVIKEKQKTGPSQRLLYLGLEVCTVSLKFFISDLKMTKLVEKISSAVNAAPHIEVRTIASILGLLMSCSRALGPMTRIMTRTNYAWIQSSLELCGWDGLAAYPSNCRKEFLFWLNHLAVLLPLNLKKTLTSTLPGTPVIRGCMPLVMGALMRLLPGGCSPARNLERVPRSGRCWFFMRLIVLRMLSDFLARGFVI